MEMARRRTACLLLGRDHGHAFRNALPLAVALHPGIRPGIGSVEFFAVLIFAFVRRSAAHRGHTAWMRARIAPGVEREKRHGESARSRPEWQAPFLTCQGHRLRYLQLASVDLRLAAETEQKNRRLIEVMVKSNGKEWGFEINPNGKFVKKHDDHTKTDR